MEIHLSRAKELLRKRSIGGWILLLLTFLWKRLGDWQTVEWLAHKVFPPGVLRLPPTSVTVGLFVCALIWFTAVILWPGRQGLNPVPPRTQNISQARADRELHDLTLRDRITSLTEEIFRFLEEFGPRPQVHVDYLMTDEEILGGADGEQSGHRSVEYTTPTSRDLEIELLALSMSFRPKASATPS